MTTYSKETALYDTGAIANDIDDAGTKADNYLTDVTGGGVMVHPSDDSTTGWKISSALELLKSGVSYIWAGLVNNIATVRIGKENGGHSVIDENGMRVYGDSNGNTQLANIGYGEGSAQTGTAITPYYTFGVRKTTATAYSSSSTYVVGDMCVHNEKVYVCIDDITTPESWTSSHWRYYIGNYSHAEGLDTIASGAYSHAEGERTKAIGMDSHAEGYYAIASVAGSHAEGYGTTASGLYSHAEGYMPSALSQGAHAEGYETTASGSFSHSEGQLTTASGERSHAEGTDTVASASNSHAQNIATIAAKWAQTALGTWNIEDTSATTTHPKGVVEYGQYAVIVGNGTSDSARSNALTVGWDGNITVQNHSSPIGTTHNEYPTSTVSVKSSTATALCSVSLEPGLWLCVCAVRHPQANGGVRRANLRTASGSTEIDVQEVCNANNSVQQQLVRLVRNTGTTNVVYYLNAYQNSGSKLTYAAGDNQYANYICAVRIL